MAGFLTRFRVALIVFSVIIGLILVISACNQIRFGQDVTSGQTQTKIVAPVESGSGQEANVFVNSPLQIQSVYTSANISRVELTVQRDTEQPQLIRADVPSNGSVTQAWTPGQPGTYMVTTEAFNSTGGSEARLMIRLMPNRLTISFRFRRRQPKCKPLVSLDLPPPQPPMSSSSAQPK